MDTRVDLHTAIKVYDTLQILDGAANAAPSVESPLCLTCLKVLKLYLFSRTQIFHHMGHKIRNDFF
jgi:hypothetical protein